MSEGSGEKDVMEQAMREATANLIWPMLTRTNYQEWSALVQCNLEGMYLWDMIESNTVY
jgi:hypothetical protein